MTQQPELFGGPYEPPACQVGDWLNDEIDGALEVGGWTDAPISWPRRKKTGRHSPILCGDLVRAVHIESVEAIRRYWAVGTVTVWKWRQALGIGRVTDGTRKLLQERTGVPHEAAARGRAHAASEESRAKMAETKRGKEAHPNTKAALLRAAKRKKGAVWGVKANAWMRGEQLPELHTGEWTAAEDALLIKHRHRRVEAAAALLGRTPAAAQGRRAKLGLATPIGEVLWSEAEEQYLVDHYSSMGAEHCARHLGRSVIGVASMAHLLGVTKAQQQPRRTGRQTWTQEEDDLLRKYHPTRTHFEISKMLRRSAFATARRAQTLGLPHKIAGNKE